MLFPYDLAASRQANAVVGRFTLTGALDAILEGSGLSGGLNALFGRKRNPVNEAHQDEEMFI